MRLLYVKSGFLILREKNKYGVHYKPNLFKLNR